MSERKTTEIKLRVTPSFKAAVQLAAETAGETMSVYIEKASQDRMAAERVAAVSATGFATDTGEPQIGPPIGPIDGFLDGLAALFNPPVAPNPVPAKSDKGACEKNCSPWQWCECKAGLGG